MNEWALDNFNGTFCDRIIEFQSVSTWAPIHVSLKLSLPFMILIDMFKCVSLVCVCVFVCARACVRVCVSVCVCDYAVQ